MEGKILFIDPTQTDYTMVGRTVSPLGASYLAAVAEQKGLATKIIHQLDSSNSQVLAEVTEFDPEIICFCSVMSKNRKNVLAMANKIKEENSNRIILVGGDDPSDWPPLVKHPCLDFIGIGAGEPVISDFIDFLAGYRKPHEIRGLGYFHKGEVVQNPMAKITNLDDFPFPLRRNLPWHKYRSFIVGENMLGNDEIYLNMRASMGCKNRCPWCNTWKNFPYMAHRSVGNIREEIRQISRDFQIGFIDFVDTDLASNRRWFIKLCRMLTKFDFHWRMFAHPKNIDRPLLEIASLAGCKVIFYGLETVDDARLRRVKGVSLDRVSRVVKMTHLQGIHTIVSFMLGWENETNESLGKVKDYLVKNPSERWYVTFYTNFPAELSRGTDTDRLHTNDPLRNRKNLSRKELLSWKKELLIAAHNSQEYKKLYQQNCCRGGVKTEKSYQIYFDFMKKFGNIEIIL